MSLTIKNHRVVVDGKAVIRVPSPYTSGAFSKDHPKILVMHFTYGASAMSSAKWFQSPDNKGSSAHVVIDRDGTVIQCVDFDTIAWHAGQSKLGNLSGLNQYSIGIELANWGYLRRSATGWSSYTNVAIAEPYIAAHKNGNPDGSTSPIGWEPYPDAQFDRAVEVAQALVSAYGIDRIVGHDDIAPTRKWDPGPAFAMERFKQTVLASRGDGGFPVVYVESADGLNLRRGPSMASDSIRLLANGQALRPIELSGNWMMVGVIEAGAETQSGWVHRAYLRS